MSQPVDEKTKQKHFACRNCNKVFRHDYANKGFLCAGLPKTTIRKCDVIRTCQRFDDGKESRIDVSLDEAACHALAFQVAISSYLQFFHKRPCKGCSQKNESCGPAAFKESR